MTQQFNPMGSEKCRCRPPLRKRNMIYTLSVRCVWGVFLEEPFERVIELPENMTLGELHDIIQDLAGFDRDHLFTFFIARGPRGKRTEIIETEEWEERQDRLYEIPLRHIFPLPQNMKLFYHFDFGDDWIFQIGKRGKLKEEQGGIKYPRVIKEEGPKPVQYPR